MKKRNALMVGVLAIVGIVSSVAILARKKQVFYTKPIHKARGMKYKTAEQAMEDRKKVLLKASKERGLTVSDDVKKLLEEMARDEKFSVGEFQKVIEHMEESQGM